MTDLARVRTRDLVPRPRGAEPAREVSPARGAALRSIAGGPATGGPATSSEGWVVEDGLLVLDRDPAPPVAEVLTRLLVSGGQGVLVRDSRAVDEVYLRRLGWHLAAGGRVLLVRRPPLSTLPHGARPVVLPGGDIAIRWTPPPRRRSRRAAEAAGRVLAASTLLAVSPLIGLGALAVRLDSPGPAFFTQTRVGRDGRSFRMWKLRSMHVDAEARRAELDEAQDGAGPLFKMRRDPRVTRVGRVLRRFSLDELPQLWNVVRGDMVLVGPRPALPTEVATYDEDVARRLAVKPGVTGLWQVSGRSDLSWEDSVLLDLHFVEHWSLGMELRILGATLAAVVGGRGAY